MPDSPLWTWMRVAEEGWLPTLGLRWPLWSSDAAARAGRERIIDMGAAAFEDADLFPVTNRADTSAPLAVNWPTLPESERAGLIVVDPSGHELAELYVMEGVLHGPTPEFRAGAAAAFADLAEAGELVSVLSPGRLYAMADRRLVEAPPATPAPLLEQWQREAERLSRLAEPTSGEAK